MYNNRDAQKFSEKLTFLRDSTGSKGLQGKDQGQRHTVSHTMRPSLSVPAVPAASRVAPVAGVFVCTRECMRLLC